MASNRTPFYFTIAQRGKGTNATIAYQPDGTAAIISTPGNSPVPFTGDFRDLPVRAINACAGAARDASYVAIDHYNLKRLEGHYSEARNDWMPLGQFVTTGPQVKSTQYGLDLIEALAALYDAE
jgi:hypothetical protein